MTDPSLRSAAEHGINSLCSADEGSAGIIARTINLYGSAKYFRDGRGLLTAEDVIHIFKMLRTMLVPLEVSDPPPSFLKAPLKPEDITSNV